MSQLTTVQLAEVKMGMSSDQVKAILGRPADTQVHGAVGLTSTTYVYRSGKSEIKIVFLNNRVMAIDGELKK